MLILKDEAYRLRAAWTRALRDVAKQLGYKPNHHGESDHPVVRILGALAWGRFEYEPGSCDSKDRAVRGLGYLEGVRDAALRAARELGDREADRLLCEVPGLVRRDVYQ